MMTLKKFLFGLCGLTTGSIYGSYVKNLIAMRNIYVNSSKDDSYPYVSDGLIFIGNEITPPTSGTQVIDLKTDVDKFNWTIEWCGIHIDNNRANNFMFPYSSIIKANSWVPGWWVNSNQININARVQYGEFNSKQECKKLVHLANAIDNGSLMKMYAAGKLFSTNINLIAQSLSYISGQTFRYIICPTTEYCYIKCIRVYNRSLTNNEIENNYQIDKERFEL